MSKVTFVTDYWDWLKKKGYKPEDAEKRELLNEFYHTDFHQKHPDYKVNGVEYFQALGKL